MEKLQADQQNGAAILREMEKHACLNIEKQRQRGAMIMFHKRLGKEMKLKVNITIRIIAYELGLGWKLKEL